MSEKPNVDPLQAKRDEADPSLFCPYSVQQRRAGLRQPSSILLKILSAAFGGRTLHPHLSAPGASVAGIIYCDPILPQAEIEIEDSLTPPPAPADDCAIHL